MRSEGGGVCLVSCEMDKSFFHIYSPDDVCVCVCVCVRGECVSVCLTSLLLIFSSLASVFSTRYSDIVAARSRFEALMGLIISETTL